MRWIFSFKQKRLLPWYIHHGLLLLHVCICIELVPCNNMDFCVTDTQSNFLLSDILGWCHDIAWTFVWLPWFRHHGLLLLHARNLLRGLLPWLGHHGLLYHMDRKVSGATDRTMLHPSILIKQLGLERLPKTADGGGGKPLLHQAVHIELQYENPKGLLSLAKLLEIGFDVNVLDEYGQTALNQIFKTSCHSSKASTIIQKFMQPGN